MRGFLRLQLAIGLLMSHSVASAVEHVYLTHSRSGLPVYTNQPTQAGAKLVATFAAPLPRGARYARMNGASRGTVRFVSRQSAPAAGIDALIKLASKTHEVEEALLRAVIEVESRFNPSARSPRGAMGLMQLMPGTARRFGVVDAYDPWQNIEGGTLYLKKLLEMFGGNQRLALAAYNAGEGAVIRYGRRIPPFAETQAYVSSVLARYRKYMAHAKTAAVPAPP